MPQQLT